MPGAAPAAADVPCGAGRPGNHGRPGTVGFTLVELCITLAVLAALGALAAPSFSNQVARQRLQSAARHLQADIALARAESDKHGVAVTLTFQPGRDWCYSLGWGVPLDCRSVSPPPATPLPHGMLRVVRAADSPGVLLLDAGPIVLDQRSAAGAQAQALAGLTGGQARFASLADPTQVLLVRVGPQGRASVCAAGAAIGGMAGCGVAAGMR